MITLLGAGSTQFTGERIMNDFIGIDEFDKFSDITNSNAQSTPMQRLIVVQTPQHTNTRKNISKTTSNSKRQQQQNLNDKN